MAGIHQTLKEARSLYAEALKLQEAVLASHRDLEGCVAQIQTWHESMEALAAWVETLTVDTEDDWHEALRRGRWIETPLQLAEQIGGGLTPPAKGKTKAFIIGKEMKTKDLRQTAAERGETGRQQNPTQNPG